MPVEPPIDTPASLAEAYAVLADSTADAQITPIAGGTDVMVRITGEIGEPPARMVDLSRLGDLRGIAVEGAAVVIGALTTYTDIRRSGVCREHLPALVDEGVFGGPLRSSDANAAALSLYYNGRDGAHDGPGLYLVEVAP